MEKHIEEYQNIQKARIDSCFIQKGEDASASVETQESDEFKHHRLMAGYHSIKASELKDESLKLNSATDPELHNDAKERQREAARHESALEEHREKAKSLYNEEKHGPWNDTVPTKAAALKYGSKQAKEMDATKQSEDDVEDVKKSDDKEYYDSKQYKEAVSKGGVGSGRKEGSGLKTPDFGSMIHTHSKQISNHAGISEEEYKKLHPGTKTELAHNYHKEGTKTDSYKEANENIKKKVIGDKKVEGKNEMKKSEGDDASFHYTSQSGKSYNINESLPDHAKNDLTKEDHTKLAELHNKVKESIGKDNSLYVHHLSSEMTHKALAADKDLNNEIVGKLNSGKVVRTNPQHSDHLSFTADEHREAAGLYGDNKEAASAHLFAAKKQDAFKTLGV